MNFNSVSYNSIIELDNVFFSEQYVCDLILSRLIKDDYIFKIDEDILNELLKKIHIDKSTWDSLTYAYSLFKEYESKKLTPCKH